MSRSNQKRTVSGTSLALTVKELEIVRAEMAKEEFKLSSKERCFSWTVLMVLLLAQISNQWQRFMISTAYNFKLPDNEKDPYYMMSVAIPNFSESRYGLLSGVLFTSLFSVTVLFSGVLSDNCSRRLLLACAAVLWSLTSITTSISQIYSEVAASRMMLGFFEAFCGPPAYSLIVDYFPPETRTTANAVYAFGIYVGSALSSIIIVMIENVGWRWAYAITGSVGVFIGLLVIVVVRDPIRGRFEPRVDVAKIEEQDAFADETEEFAFSPTTRDSEKPVEKKDNLCKRYLGGFKAMITNKTCFYVVLGACFRYWQGYSIAYFAFGFFSDYNMNTLYGTLNGLAVLIGGFSSQLIAGQLSDRLEARYPTIKPMICVIMSLNGVLFCSLLFLFTFSFYFSIACLFLQYLLSEGWMSPAVAMIQATIDVRFKGVAMGVFLFATAIFGTIGSLVIGVIIDDFHIKSQTYKGEIIAINTALPCLISALLFYIAKSHYADFRRQVEIEKEEASVKASQYNFEDSQSVQQYGYFKRSDSDNSTY